MHAILGGGIALLILGLFLGFMTSFNPYINLNAPVFPLMQVVVWTMIITGVFGSLLGATWDVNKRGR